MSVTPLIPGAHHDPWQEAVWPVTDERDRPLDWSLDPDGETVQGPLDLCFLRGRDMMLTLGRDEVALLSVRGRLRRIMLTGRHWLAVGKDDSCPGDGMLYFLRLDQPIVVDWRQYVPVPRHDSTEPATTLHSGRFVVTVEQPVRFYETLLCNRSGEGNAICLPTLRHLLPTLLTIRLTAIEPPGPGGLAELLAQLDPSLLDDDLAPYGLACRGWSIRRRSEPRPEPFEAPLASDVTV